MSEVVESPQVGPAEHPLARRDLVPTERQRVPGVEPSGGQPAPVVKVVDDGPAASRGERAREYLRGLDPRGLRGSKTPVMVFALLALFSEFDDAVFQVILPELRSEFGGDIGPLLVAGTAVSILVTASLPVFGYLIDRVNRVRLVQVSHIGTNVIGLAAPVLARSLLGVTLYRGAAGFVGGMHKPAPASLLPDYYDVEDYSRVLIFLPAMAAIGLIVAPIVAGYAVDRTGGWRPAATYLGLFATAVSFVTLFLREPRRAGRQLAEAGVQDVDRSPPRLAESLRTIRAIRTLRRIWIAHVFTGAAAFGATFFLALYWAQVFGLTPSQRGLLVSVAAGARFLALVGTAPMLAKIAARRPSRIMLIFGGVYAALAIFVIVLAVSDNLTLSIIASIPVAAGPAILEPAVAIVLIRLVPADVRGLGVTSIGPFVLMGQIVFTVVATTLPSSSGGLRGLAFAFVPFFLIGGYLLSSASKGVDRDIRAAEAATVARMAARKENGGRTDVLLVCRDIDVEFGGATILNAVDLDVRRGELLALLGTNGAGKSTLLKVIAGVVPAANGAIYFDGRNITNEPPHLNVAHGVVLVPGGRAVFPTLTVEENLRCASLNHPEGSMTLDDVFELFPVLPDRLGQRAGDLSGGEQQMVALAQALLMRPELLMIDELSLGLAPTVVEQLLDVLRTINERGTTVIIVEQSVNVALTIARRTVFLDKGRVEFDGPTDELLARPDLLRSVFMGGAATGVAPSTRSRRPSDEAVQVLRVEDLSVQFGGIRALDGVSLGVDAGEILGVFGPNGAGKTTLFDAISGFVPTLHGSVAIDGIDVTGASPDARARGGLARSFQDARLFPSMTVRENIAVAFERAASHNVAAALVWAPSVRRSEDRIRRRVDGLIDLLSLGAFADKLLGELSTGTRRAVDVAVIMAADPKVLLLDEPSSGLAQPEVELLGPLISRLARDTGCGIVVIEHDLPLLVAVSHRMLAMDRGRRIAGGPPDEVLHDHDVLTAYLNASEAVLSRSGSTMSTIAAALGAAPSESSPNDEDSNS